MCNMPEGFADYLDTLGSSYPIYDKGVGKRVLEKLGLKGLSMKRKKNKTAATREMYDRLVARFPILARQTKHLWRASTPRVGGREISIATLVLMELGLLRVDLDDFVPEITAAYQKLLFRGERGQDLVEILCELEIYIPPTQLIDALDKWLVDMIRGKHTTMFMAVCPDYSHEDGKYTFRALWNGVGLVAQRSLEAIRRFHEYAQGYEFDLHFIVAMADFEADCEKNRRLVGNISADEFRHRCQESMVALREQLCNLVPGIESHLQTPFITEIAGGTSRWDSVYAEAQEAARYGNLCGPFNLTGHHLSKIVRGRAAMNAAWSDDGADFDAFNALRQQVPDYGAVGAVVFRKIATTTNLLLLGLDSVWMAPFIHQLLDSCAPVLYMRRLDY